MNDESSQLTPCRDCQNPCSSSATSCPKCGCNDPTGAIAVKIATAQKQKEAVEAIEAQKQKEAVEAIEAQQEAAKKSSTRWTLGCIGFFIVASLSMAVCINSIPDDPNYTSFDERMDTVNKEREKYGMAPLSPREYNRREKGWSKILPPK